MFFSSLRFRKELYDADMLMLQVGAAHMEPNSFLINVLNKFNLVAWANKSFDLSEDDSLRQTTTLVEEFLGNIIAIMSERFSPGVGDVREDNLWLFFH